MYNLYHNHNFFIMPYRHETLNTIMHNFQNVCLIYVIFHVCIVQCCFISSVAGGGGEEGALVARAPPSALTHTSDLLR